MLYSIMTPQQRQALLGNPQNYPLRIRFLGKIGLLGPDAVQLLVQRGVDFDLDDDQMESVLAGNEIAALPVPSPEGVAFPLPASGGILPRASAEATGLRVVWLVLGFIVAGGLYLARQLGRSGQQGQATGESPRQRASTRSDSSIWQLGVRVLELLLLAGLAREVRAAITTIAESSAPGARAGREQRQSAAPLPEEWKDDDWSEDEEDAYWEVEPGEEPRR